MHICMVVFTDLPFDYRVYREAHSLQQAGHEITVISSQFRPEPLPTIWQDIDVRLVPIDRNRSLRLTYPHFWRIAGRLAADIAADAYHAHDLDVLWPTARAARRHDAALVYDSHELFCEQSSLVQRPAVAATWRLLERRLIHQADRVITVGPQIARRLQQAYRLSREPLVLRNMPLYKHPIGSRLLRQQLAIPEVDPVILYQGGFLTDNGLLEQIEAMQQVEIGHFVLLGSGPTEAALRQRVEDLNLRERVHFLARVPFEDLHPYTCSADLGVCIIKPSGRSFAWSMPNKLFEYMMAGLPVVAGDTPEIRQVIDATDAGIVVDPIDTAAIAGALNVLLADPERRDKLAAAARFAARQNCWETESAGLLELYSSL